MGRVELLCVLLVVGLFWFDVLLWLASSGWPSLGWGLFACVVFLVLAVRSTLQHWRVHLGCWVVVAAVIGIDL